MTPDWHGELRARGYRLTPQRQLVLEAVTALGHASAEAILAHVQRTAQGVNISTVYRTLDLLEQLELVRHAHLGHGAPTYHPATADEHLHLVCRDCDSVTEIAVETAGAFADRLADEHGFETDVQHFAVYGRCARCVAGNPAAASRAVPS